MHSHDLVVHMDNDNLVSFDFKNENRQKFSINYDYSNRYYTFQNVENSQFLTCDDSTIFLQRKVIMKINKGI